MDQASKPTSAVAPISATPVTPEQPKAPAPAEQDLATKRLFADLARKEKALQADKRRFEEERKQFQSQQSQQPDWKSRASKDPLGLLAEAGISYDQLSQMLLSDPKGFEFAQLKQELEALKKGQQETLSQAEKIQKQNYDNAIKSIGREVSLLIDGNDAYEAVRLEGDSGKDAIIELIKQTHADEGIVLSVQEAARQVEEYYVEKAKAYTSLKKLKAAEPAKESTQEALASTEQLADQKSQKPKYSTLPYREHTRISPGQTLTNSMTVSTRSSNSEAERIQRAILAGQGQLNK